MQYSGIESFTFSEAVELARMARDVYGVEVNSIDYRYTDPDGVEYWSIRMKNSGDPLASTHIVYSGKEFDKFVSRRCYHRRLLVEPASDNSFGATATCMSCGNSVGGIEPKLYSMSDPMYHSRIASMLVEMRAMLQTEEMR